MSKIWQCKIGETESVPHGADLPMREAVARAYELIAGKSPDFLFSGWGAELSEPERAVVEDRLPVQADAQRLSNDELVQAIERAQYLTRNTATGEVIYKSWVAHLEALLQAQRDRAALSVGQQG